MIQHSRQNFSRCPRLYSVISFFNPIADAAAADNAAGANSRLIGTTLEIVIVLMIVLVIVVPPITYWQTVKVIMHYFCSRHCKLSTWYLEKTLTPIADALPSRSYGTIGLTKHPFLFSFTCSQYISQQYPSLSLCLAYPLIYSSAFNFSSLL